MNIVDNEKINIEVVAKKLRPVFKKYNVNKAILFGSVANNTNNENSDVDLLVDSGLKGLRFLGLANDIEEALNIDVDVFDVTHINKNSIIDNEIKMKGVVIYG